MRRTAKCGPAASSALAQPIRSEALAYRGWFWSSASIRASTADDRAARANGKPTWKHVSDQLDFDGAEYRFRACPRVPYRLPKVLGADTVFVPEGEKDVATLESWGLVASCHPGGSGSSHLYAAWAGHFRDRHIVILPDNDAPGRKHAAAVAGHLLLVAASLRVVELLGLPAKGDVTDWKEAGGTRKQFLTLVAEVAPLDAPGLAALRDRWGLAETPTERPTRAQVGEEWPTPEPLADSLPPVLPFDERLLPEAFRPLVADVTARMRVPMDYPAVAITLCLSGVVNRRAVVQPKVLDSSWVVAPDLWGGISAITRPLTQIQAEWRREHEAELAECRSLMSFGQFICPPQSSKCRTMDLVPALRQDATGQLAAPRGYPGAQSDRDSPEAARYNSIRSVVQVDTPQPKKSVSSVRTGQPNVSAAASTGQSSSSRCLRRAMSSNWE